MALLEALHHVGRATASESSEKQCESQANPSSALLVPRLTSSGTINSFEQLTQDHATTTLTRLGGTP